MATNEEEEAAFEMFKAIHDRVGHHFRSSAESYFNMLPDISRMWIEVVRFAADTTARHDADAYEMHCIIHARIGDGRDISREEFESDVFESRTGLRRAWLEIADEVRAQAQRRRAAQEV